MTMMISDYSKCKLAFTAILFILLAYYYPFLIALIQNRYSIIFNNNANQEEIIKAANLNGSNSGGQMTLANEFSSIESQIIKSWKHLVVLPKRVLDGSSVKIAIGVNTNVDLIVSGTALFRELKSLTSASAKLTLDSSMSKNHQKIDSLNEFKECFKYFFQKGSAAERSISNQEDFDLIIKAANNLKEKNWFIGGNAALMAQGISNRFQNTEILLIGPVGKKLKQLLNENIKIPEQCLIENDEVHLILEYNSTESFENVLTKASNRFIVSHDVFNAKMLMMTAFFDACESFKPDLIVLSGLHLIESQSNEFVEQTLSSLRDHLRKHVINSNHHQAIHLELASIGDKNLMRSILEHGILQEINSLGLNEQELLFLSFASSDDLSPPHKNYYQDLNGQPDLLKVLDLLEWTMRTFGRTIQSTRDDNDDSSRSKLARIHFHCLMYHILVISDAREWSNSESSLMSGAKIAAKQACGQEYSEDEKDEQLIELVEFRLSEKLIGSNNSNHIMRLEIESGKFIEINSTYPIAAFKRNDINFYFTPVLVCKSPLKTVGLGDAISSNGLFYSSFNKIL